MRINIGIGNRCINCIALTTSRHDQLQANMVLESRRWRLVFTMTSFGTDDVIKWDESRCRHQRLRYTRRPRHLGVSSILPFRLWISTPTVSISTQTADAADPGLADERRGPTVIRFVKKIAQEDGFDGGQWVADVACGGGSLGQAGSRCASWVLVREAIHAEGIQWRQRRWSTTKFR